MSGFAVEFRRDNRPACADNANRMTGSLSFLGSDRKAAEAHGSFGFSWVQSAGFSHQDRFERQPMQAGERWRGVFLGRLNHRDDLCEALGIGGKDAERLPDCQLAFAAWHKWGTDCRQHLSGFYALVICDLEHLRLIAIRSADRSPNIYYHCDRDRIVLATATAAVFSGTGLEKSINEEKVADALALNLENSRQSYFEGVSILSAGETLSIGTGDGPAVSHHDFLDEAQPLFYERDEDYVDHARELLDRAVAGAFRHPGQTGILLSGGLDSTALAVAAIEHLRGSEPDAAHVLKSYTSIPDSTWDNRVRAGWMGDESDHVRAMAGMYSELDPSFVSAEGLPFDHHIDMVQSYADMPIRAVTNAGWSRAIRHKARQDGVRTLISGSAGNATLSFSAALILFGQWLREGKWGQLIRETRLFAARHPESQPARLLWQAAVMNMPNGAFDRYAKWRGHRINDGFTHYSAINPDYADQMEVTDRMAKSEWDDRRRPLPNRRKMMRQMLRQGARNDSGGLIEPMRVMDQVQTISVLDDRKLLSFCYAIPDDQFYRGGINRRLIKRMMKGKLPEKILKAPRGEQGADWHSRQTLELDRISDEIERLADMPDMARRLDIKRMRKMIRNWPAQTPVSASEYADYALARYGMSRAIAMARFINQVEGRN